MARKKSFLALILGLALLCCIGAALGMFLRHEPRFYRNVAIPAGPEREKMSRACMGEMAKLIAFFKEGPDKEWAVEFSEGQVNSYFAEDFRRIGEDAKNLEKQGITAPRVCFEKDHFRLAFRYTNALISTVISLDLRIWVAPKEMNVFAIEILGRHAGGLPLTSQTVQDEITRLARSYNLEANWYRHEGHPVALVHLKSRGPLPPTRFLRLDVQSGKLIIGGVSLDPPPPNAQMKKRIEPVGN